MSFDIDREALYRLPKPAGIVSLRHLLSVALDLDEPMSLADFGYIIGYDGKNVFQTVDKIERGVSGVSSITEQRLRDLAQSALPFMLDVIVKPRWCEVHPVNPEEDAGDVHIIHAWFPRVEFVLTDAQVGFPYEHLGYSSYGMLKNQMFPTEWNDIYVKWIDFLPKDDMKIPYLMKAAEIFTLLDQKAANYLFPKTD